MSESMAGRPSPCNRADSGIMRVARVMAQGALVALLMLTGIAANAADPAVAGKQPPAPPVAPERPHTVTAPFGSRSDPWFWLRDDSRTDPAMLDYLAAENAWRESVMAPLKPLENALFDEIVGRLKQDDSTVPQRRNGYWYYQRYETGKQYPIVARRKGTLDAPEEILVDGNARAEGHPFYQLGTVEVSSDGNWAAIAEDTVGRRQYTVTIKDLARNAYLPGSLRNVEPMLAWANDNRTLVYIRKDPQTLLGNQVYRHLRGTDPIHDALVFEETDTSFYTGVTKSKSDRFIFIVSQSTVATEFRYADASDTALTFRVAVPRERDHLYDLADLGDRFILRTNWQAPNYRIVSAPMASVADRASWQDVVPHRADAFIQAFEAFAGHLVLSERSGGLSKLRVRSWDGKDDRLLDADDAAYTMGLGENTETETTLLRYVYTSPTTPPSVWDYDMVTGKRTLLKQDPVLGGFDSKNYVTEFRQATARDGTKVPVTLLYRRGTRPDGSAPLYQYAYGSYGNSTDPVFRASVLSLVDRGFVYAIAHVRGGQELGREWYEQGRLGNKKNTFTDFIDVTRYLTSERLVDPARVFGMGGSAGGLLIGAVANMAPDDYRGLIAHVPFVDVVTTMLDATIPLTANEYDEWGNPGADRAAYDYMLSYSPYDQVTAQNYPALFVTGGLWDSQVQYWEPAKWVARLRATKTDDRPLLMRMNMDAGHGGKSGRFDRYREIAEEYAFVLWQAGIER